MHEWALAEAVIETIVLKAKESGRKTFSYLKIILGKLRQIDIDVFTFALNELLKLTKNELGIEVKDIAFEYEDIEVQCNRCGFKWRIDIESLEEPIKEYIHFVPDVVHTYISCPRCGSHDYEIVSGLGIAVEVE